MAMRLEEGVVLRSKIGDRRRFVEFAGAAPAARTKLPDGPEILGRPVVGHRWPGARPGSARMTKVSPFPASPLAEPPALMVLVAIDVPRSYCVAIGSVSVGAFDDSLEILLEGVAQTARHRPWCARANGLSIQSTRGRTPRAGAGEEGLVHAAPAPC